MFCKTRPASRMISIHASNKGGDAINGYFKTLESISIHASNKGGDAESLYLWIMTNIFQSTPPTKEATYQPLGITLSMLYFNPRLQQRRRQQSYQMRLLELRYFNPRLQQRRRRFSFLATISFPSISIHASNKGGDLLTHDRIREHQHFNPRLQQRRRLAREVCEYVNVIFQSTPPTKEATPSLHKHSHLPIRFQSTPPTKEATGVQIRKRA